MFIKLFSVNIISLFSQHHLTPFQSTPFHSIPVNTIPLFPVNATHAAENFLLEPTFCQRPFQMGFCRGTYTSPYQSVCVEAARCHDSEHQVSIISNLALSLTNHTYAISQTNRLAQGEQQCSFWQSS